ncbi:LOW QUALITY PROTEIN: syntaxin-17 [Vipera latastei]
MSKDEEKVNLRRLEPAIQKFIKVAIPTDLERLRKHQINIEKYQRCRLWDKLHEEHINAGRTVQQLRANIREMENLCSRVRKEDILTLQRMIDPVKEEASLAVKEFLQLHSESAEVLKRQFREQEASSSAAFTRSTTIAAGTVYLDGENSLSQIFAPLPEIPQDQNAAESWEVLEEDLIELSTLVTEFSLLVHVNQQEKVDRIEENVCSAVANGEGTRNLSKPDAVGGRFPGRGWRELGLSAPSVPVHRELPLRKSDKDSWCKSLSITATCQYIPDTINGRGPDREDSGLQNRGEAELMDRWIPDLLSKSLPRGLKNQKHRRQLFFPSPAWKCPQTEPKLPGEPTPSLPFPSLPWLRSQQTWPALRPDCLRHWAFSSSVIQLSL